MCTGVKLTKNMCLTAFTVDDGFTLTDRIQKRVATSVEPPLAEPKRRKQHD